MSGSGSASRRKSPKPPQPTPRRTATAHPLRPKPPRRGEGVEVGWETQDSPTTLSCLTNLSCLIRVMGLNVSVGGGGLSHHRQVLHPEGKAKRGFNPPSIKLQSTNREPQRLTRWETKHIHLELLAQFISSSKVANKVWQPKRVGACSWRRGERHQPPQGPLPPRGVSQKGREGKHPKTPQPPLQGGNRYSKVWAPLIMTYSM